MKIELIVSIIAGLFAFSTAFLAYLLQKRTEKLKIVEKQLAESKLGAYSRLVSIFYDILKNVKNGIEHNQSEMAKKLMEAKKELFIFGSDQVFLKLNQWLLHLDAEGDNMLQMKYFLDLLIEIRKDMGHQSTRITKKDILISLMHSEIEVNKFKHLYE